MLRNRFHEWFIRYNPLYFASALSVLVGVLLLGQGFEEAGRPEARVDLTYVLEAYQILVIAGAALLLRRAVQCRPAVILGLLQALFLVDVTFQNEVLALYEKRLLALGWFLWAMVKLGALCWALRLRPRLGTLAVPVLAVLGVVATPQLMDAGLVDRSTALLAATWYAAEVLALALKLRPRAATSLRLDRWGRTVLRRGLRAAVRIWASLLVLHVVASAIVFEVEMGWIYLAPWLLVFAFLHRKEGWAWAGAALAVLFATASTPTVAPTAFLAALALGWRGRHEGCPRFYVGSVLAAHVALRAFGWQEGTLPEAAPWLLAATVATAVVLAWRFRLALALLPMAVAVPPIARRVQVMGYLAWGETLLGAGFLSLVAGVAYNWTQRIPWRSSVEMGDEEKIKS